MALKNEDIQRIFPVFKDKMSSDEFKTKINNLTRIDHGNFLRASVTFQHSTICMRCGKFDDSTNIAMVLLCSAIEAINPKSGQILFKDWLIKECLGNLEMKSKSDVRKAIIQAYDEFLKLPKREGALYNFKEFLKKNCPECLSKSVPIKIKEKPERGQPRQAEFGEALEYIYGIFRSLHLHEAISLASYESPKEPHTRLGGATQWHSYKKKQYRYDLLKTLPWFSNVVKESLYNYLITPRKMQR